MNFAKIVEHKKSVILLVNGFSKKDINNKIYITKSYDPNDYVTLDAIFKVFSKKDLSAYYKISHQLYLELVALKHK